MPARDERARPRTVRAIFAVAGALVELGFDFERALDGFARFAARNAQ
jgi:hypothetical protein